MEHKHHIKEDIALKMAENGNWGACHLFQTAANIHGHKGKSKF